MLPPEPDVLLARQAFDDAQAAMVGAETALGYYTASWYGTDVNDERGSFAICNDTGPLTNYVGNYLALSVGHHKVYVYVIATQTNLISDIALARRAFLAIGLLAVDPIRVKASLVA